MLAFMDAFSRPGGGMLNALTARYALSARHVLHSPHAQFFSPRSEVFTQVPTQAEVVRRNHAAPALSLVSMAT